MIELRHISLESVNKEIQTKIKFRVYLTYKQIIFENFLPSKSEKA